MQNFYKIQNNKTHKIQENKLKKKTRSKIITRMIYNEYHKNNFNNLKINL